MTSQSFLDGKVILYSGDSREVMASLPDCSVDSIVTDPPYALTAASRNGSPRNNDPETPFGRTKLGERGFMGKTWDVGDTAFAVEFWAEALRVLKPGGHILAFGGTRTYHRLACAIEDAGFEIRDCIMWVYGSGFNKVGYIKDADGEHVMQGWGGALKPALEPIVMARKPLIGTVAENVLTHGTGALNIDGCRIQADGRPLRVLDAKPTDSKVYSGRTGEGGLGKGLDGGSKAVGTTDIGRWPANLIHDGSEEVLACFPDAPGQQRPVTGVERAHRTLNAYGDFGSTRDGFEPRNDSGSAARFFYTAKADADDRIGSKHPTVKPLDLMQYLVRLVTPRGGTVLDPFAGTGTTGEAAWREGMKAILIEREAEYQEDIARRMDLVTKPSKRAAVAKTKNKIDDHGPLFAESE